MGGVFELASPRESHDKVLQLLEQHTKWFSESIPLIASENVPSPAVAKPSFQTSGIATRNRPKPSRLQPP